MANFNFSQLHFIDQLNYCTARIESTDSRGNISSGSGFYYQVHVTDETAIHLLITNKHVIENAVTISLPINIANNNGDYIYFETFVVSEFNEKIIYHPDEAIDLCGIPVSFIQEGLKQVGLQHYKINLSKGILPTDEELSNLLSVENILMVGYPNGLWDYQNNKPLFRRGITATSAVYDYNGKSEFVIDAACFPGSSGSPVFLYDPLTLNRTARHVKLGTRYALLGVLYAGPQHTAKGDIRIEKNSEEKVISLTQVPINLGHVIKAKNILAIEELAIEAHLRLVKRVV